MTLWKKITKTLSCLALTATLTFSLGACDLGGFLESAFGSFDSDTDSSSSGGGTSSGGNSSSSGGGTSSGGNSSSSGGGTSSGGNSSSSGGGTSSGGNSSSSGGDTSSGGNSSSSGGDTSSGDSSGTDSSGGGDIVTEELSIYFPSFKNRVSGDCTLIKVGDTEVLIDAGSTRGSAAVIVPYIKQYCTDGILEYVIATHAHEDHIAAFVGEYGTDGVFANFECKTIIDFTAKNTTSQISADYITWRDAEVQAGAVHYTALECWKNTDGAQQSYSLSENVTLNILYQEYYEKSTANENNYSVCSMISYGGKHFLFTGDLESSGEASLLKHNDLPVCELFKSGHHGSNTSNTSALIDKIKPKNVVITCCCGDRHKFPHQETINNIAPYTKNVYVPTVASGSNEYALLNGDITVSCNGKELTVSCSNNNTLFKDTDWFKNNRTTPESWK